VLPRRPKDPVILSGTAFLAYFTAAAGIEPPTAWIFSEFVSANIASAVLVSSNPTNLLIAGVSLLVIEAGLAVQIKVVPPGNG
jgi:Na+/H+ antiporter NhaD/arsenite permease-like protein